MNCSSFESACQKDAIYIIHEKKFFLKIFVTFHPFLPLIIMDPKKGQYLFEQI